jgi:hypothetical protein
VELLEALSAVPALEDEGAAHGGLGEALLEVARLPGEDDRRERLDGVEHGVELVLARVDRQLQRLLRLPAVHSPLTRRRRLLLRRGHRRGRGLGGDRDRPVALRRVGGVGGGDGAPLHGHERGARLGGHRGAGYGRGRCGGGGVGGERHCGRVDAPWVGRICGGGIGGVVRGEGGSPLRKWRWRACRYLSAAGAGWWEWDCASTRGGWLSRWRRVDDGRGSFGR